MKTPNGNCPISRFLCNTLSCNTTSHQKPISGEDKPHSSQSNTCRQSSAALFTTKKQMFDYFVSVAMQQSPNTAFNVFGSLTHPLTRPVWCNYSAVRNNHYQYLNLSRLEEDFVSLSTFENRTMPFCPKPS